MYQDFSRWGRPADPKAMGLPTDMATRWSARSGANAATARERNTPVVPDDVRPLEAEVVEHAQRHVSGEEGDGVRPRPPACRSRRSRGGRGRRPGARRRAPAPGGATTGPSRGTRAAARPACPRRSPRLRCRPRPRRSAWSPSAVDGASKRSHSPSVPASRRRSELGHLVQDPGCARTSAGSSTPTIRRNAGRRRCRHRRPPASRVRSPMPDRRARRRPRRSPPPSRAGGAGRTPRSRGHHGPTTASVAASKSSQLRRVVGDAGPQRVAQRHACM